MPKKVARDDNWYQVVAQRIFPPGKNPIVVGVDLASEKTGMSESFKKGASTETIRCTSDWPERWVELEDEFDTFVTSVVDDRPDPYTVFIVENLNYGASHGREISGGVHAIFQKVIWQACQARPVYVDITHVKMFATGSGSSTITKKQVADGLMQMYPNMNFYATRNGRQVLNDNEADAFALMKIGEMIHEVAHGRKLASFNGRCPEILAKTLEYYDGRWKL